MYAQPAGDLCQFDEFEKVRRICTCLSWEVSPLADNCFAPLKKGNLGIEGRAAQRILEEAIKTVSVK
jgi:hypothetical protein